jgi:1-acyl-sn-glycerol-3-phosphate acyltransferase
MATASGRPEHLVRDAVIGGILAFLGHQDLLTLGEIRTALEKEVDAAGPDALLKLRERITADHGWAYYPPDPLARRIHEVLAVRFLDSESALIDGHHLEALARVPVAIFANHLSYADANVIQILLQRSGATAMAQRLTAIAGPKIFSSRERRFSSMCFGTVKVPQSADVSSGEAVLNARDVARAARHAIDVARARLDAGDALLLFGEGRRSRTGGMQPMLAAVARYLEAPGLWVVPAGHTGPEVLFPIDDARVQPARAEMRVGRPFRAANLLERAHGDRRIAMDAIGLAVAEVLPVAYRGVYGDPGAFRDACAALCDARAGCS